MPGAEQTQAPSSPGFFDRPANQSPLEKFLWGITPGGLAETYKRAIGQPFEDTVNWLTTRPQPAPLPPPPAPPVEGAAPQAPQAQPQPTNPYLQTLLQPQPKVSLPEPPKLTAPTLTENPYQKALMEAFTKGGGGVGRPTMPQFPSAPPKGTPIDWTQINQAYEAARPKKYEVDPKEMWLTGLLGALAGFGDARPGERLGITLGRMAGAGAQAGLGERKRQQELARTSDKEQSQFNLLLAQNKQGQTMTDVQRQDNDAMKTYEHGFRTWGAQMQWLNLQNDIASRNAGLAMQRLGILASLSNQDKQTQIQLQQMQNDLASGNWERASQVAKFQAQQNQTEMLRNFQMLGIISRDKQGRLGGMDQVAQISMLIPQILSNKITVPGLDKVDINNQAAALLPKNYMTLPQKEQEKLFTAAQERVLLQKMQQDPNMLLNMLRAGGGLPLNFFMSVPSGSSSVNPYLGGMNE